MTLILSCITRSHVCQVSDRRLVLIESGRPPRTFEEEATKAIFVDPVAVIGYTGLAEICDIATDAWLLEALAGKTAMIEMLPALVQRANADFPRIRAAAKLKRHAFVIAGWDVVSASVQPCPFIASVSNAEDADGFWRTLPTSQFTTSFRRLGQDNTVVHATGQVVPTGDLITLRRSIRRAAERAEAPLAIVRLLAEAIRTVARTNELVGGRLLAGVIPNGAALASGGYGLARRDGEQISFEASIPDDRATLFYLPEDDSEPGTTYGPHIIQTELMAAGVVIRQGAAGEEQIRQLESGAFRVPPPPSTPHRRRPRN